MNEKQATMQTCQNKELELYCSQALNTRSINTPAAEQKEYNIKKQKKVSSNRRKKQKQRQKKQQARNTLHQIIRNICCLKTTYQENQEIIDVLLDVDLDEERFYDFISKVTRQQMDILAEQIHALTANFCLLYKQDKAINPAEVAKIFQLIEIVKQSSNQIERIINHFIIKTEKEYETCIHRNLEFSTLKYIIDADPLKEDFEHFCHAFINDSKDKRQKIIIQQILARINCAKKFQEETASDQCNHEEQFMQYQEEIECRQIEKAGEGKKKKKKKKNKNKEEKKIESMYREIQKYNEVIKNLSEMAIWDADRKYCYIDEDWLQKLKNSVAQQKQNESFSSP